MILTYLQITSSIIHCTQNQIIPISIYFRHLHLSIRHLLFLEYGSRSRRSLGIVKECILKYLVILLLYCSFTHYFCRGLFPLTSLNNCFEAIWLIENCTQYLDRIFCTGADISGLAICPYVHVSFAVGKSNWACGEI